MSKQQQQNRRAIEEYEAAVNRFADSLAPDYAALPEGDFQAHRRALAEAERWRTENSPEKKIAQMSDRERQNYIQEFDDARARNQRAR